MPCNLPAPIAPNRLREGIPVNSPPPPDRRALLVGSSLYIFSPLFVNDDIILVPTKDNNGVFLRQYFFGEICIKEAPGFVFISSANFEQEERGEEYRGTRYSSGLGRPFD
jgi:hypothetical protein